VTIPGTLVPIRNLTIGSSPEGFAIIAMFVPGQSDAFQIIAWPDSTQPWPGPTPPAFTVNQMRVAFHKQVDAPKEMWIFGSDEQSRDHDRLNRSSDSVRWHDLIPGDTLQFKSFDSNLNLRAVYRFDKDEFWSSPLKGKLLLFNWVRDG
jgi:hypothetical protein